MRVPLRTPTGILPFTVHVVQQQVPLLIGADMLDLHQWYIRNITDEVVSATGWTVPIARAQGHSM